MCIYIYIYNESIDIENQQWLGARLANQRHP